MNQRVKNVFAMPQPDGQGYQISYEIGSSRKVHSLKKESFDFEQPPHGAGSYHDPDQHYSLMTSVAEYIKKDQA